MFELSELLSLHWPQSAVNDSHVTYVGVLAFTLCHVRTYVLFEREDPKISKGKNRGSTRLGAPTRALQGRLVDTVDTVDTTSNDIRSDIQMVQIPKSRSGLCKPRLFVGSTGHTPHQMTPISSLILAFLVKKSLPSCIAFS